MFNPGYHALLIEPGKADPTRLPTRTRHEVKWVWV